MAGIWAAIPFDIVPNGVIIKWDEFSTSYRGYQVPLDPAEFNGVVTCRFAVDAYLANTLSAAVINYVELVDENDVVYATIPFQRVAGDSNSNVISREVSWNFTESHSYTLRMVAGTNDAGFNCGVVDAKMWIDVQNSTKFITQRIMMQNAIFQAAGHLGSAALNNSGGALSIQDPGSSGYEYLNSVGNGNRWHSIYLRDDSKTATVTGRRLVVNGWAVQYFDNELDTDVNTGTAKVSLFNKTTGNQVVASEIVFDAAVDDIFGPDWPNGAWGKPLTKSTAFLDSDTDFADGDEYEIKLRNNFLINGLPSEDATPAFAFGRVDLYTVYNPATKAEIFVNVGYPLNGARPIINTNPGKYATLVDWELEVTSEKITGNATIGFIEKGGVYYFNRAAVGGKLITGYYFGGYAGHEDLVKGQTGWYPPANFGPPTFQLSGGAWRLPGTSSIPGAAGYLDADDNLISGSGSLFFPMGVATAGCAYWGSPPVSGTNQDAEVTLNGYVFDAVVDPLATITKVTLLMAPGWPRTSFPGVPYDDITMVTNAIAVGTPLAGHSNDFPSTPGVKIGLVTYFFHPTLSIDITADRAWADTDFTTANFKTHHVVTNPNVAPPLGPDVPFFLDGTLYSFRPRVEVEVSTPCPAELTFTSTTRSRLSTPIDTPNGYIIICSSTGGNAPFTIIANLIITVETAEAPSLVIDACPCDEV